MPLLLTKTKEVSDARDVLWPVGGVELLGECPGRNDSTKRSRRHALCCDIYDAMRKMDGADVKMPTYVVDPDGIGRLPKYSPEDLNVVAMDQRIRDLEKHCMTLDATLTMKTSHYDVLEDDLNFVKLAVEQHTTRFRAMEHPRKGAKKISHIPSVVPQQTSPANTIVPSPSVLSSEMTNHAETPSVPVRSEQRDDTDTTVTAVSTHPLPASHERSTGPAPSYSQLAKDLSQAGIRTDDFADFQPARKRRPKAKIVSGKSISGNTFKGGPTTRNVFLFRVNRDVNEDIVKDHMNGKELKYVSIKTMSNAEAVFKSFLITVEARDYGTIMNPDVWPSGTRLRDFRMPHGGLRNNGANKS